MKTHDSIPTTSANSSSNPLSVPDIQSGSTIACGEAHATEDTAQSKPAGANATSIRNILKDDRIRRVPLDSLKPYPGNARKHPKRQIHALTGAIQTFGLTNPILINEDNVILCGHGRREAAKALGMTDVPVIVISGLSLKEQRAFVIADNKMSDLAGWNMEQLVIELETIIEEGEVEIELTGFSTAELDIMLEEPKKKPAAGSDPDELQESDLKVSAVTVLGDLYRLGKHRLYCGDSLQDVSFKALMCNELAQMIFTDEPYNVSVNNHVRTKEGHREFAMASGEMSVEQFTAFLHTVSILMKRYSEDGSIHFRCMDWRHMREMLDATGNVYGPPKQLCVWNKNNGGMGAFYRSQYELVFVFKNGKAPHINNFGLGGNGRYRTNVWDYAGVNTFKADRADELAMHPTVKPIGLVADAIRDCSKRGGIILDPFCGSGTTIIAAERTGRVARCIELDPLYVDVTIARWQRVTGKQAVLEATGQTWDQVRAERLAVKA